MIASVIICTFNRCTLLQRLLESLTQQTVTPNSYEIIVVDDGSTDHTATVCGTMLDRLPHLKYVATGYNSGLSNAANRGIESASSAYLLFTDDDCIPESNWVEKMCSRLKQEAIVAGAVVSPTTHYFKLCHNIAQFYPFMPGQKQLYVDFIAGANMGIQAAVFKDIGVFNPETIIPDMEFILRARRQGYTIAYAATAMVVHDPARVTFRAVLGYAELHAYHTIRLRLLFQDVLVSPRLLFSPFAIALAAPLIALKTTAHIYLGHPKLLRYLLTIPTVYAIKLAWCWGALKSLLKKKRGQR